MLAGLSITELALVAMEIVVVLLGLSISYIAFRGYRRHGSRPMLFVALGFVLVVGVPAVLTVVWLFLPLLGDIELTVLNRASTITGMASILYGLWVDPE